ncbi:MAG: diaminopimelate epimerase [Candidatus Omnitrophica bacterium]|nr:diaminopimelate epimerase [Candidatus Omnitrophota bacterium]
MPKITFTKMVASGNDFIVVERLANLPASRFKKTVREICDRKYAVGADGVLLLEKSKNADIRMRIFNADGSEAEMCGNGARCIALYISRRGSAQKKIETMAGIIQAQVNGDNVKIKLTDPKDIKLDISLKVNNRELAVNFINTGVPHTVIFVEGLQNIDVFDLGRQIRYHKKFAPAGTNVDFVEVFNNDSIGVRTYERGVEGETLACGTGVVAAALIADYKLRAADFRKINVKTRSGEVLRVYFERVGSGFENVWLEGRVKIAYTGAIKI